MTATSIQPAHRLASDRLNDPKRRGSSTRTVEFSAALPHSENDLKVTCSRRHLTTAAVSFSPGGVLHTQLNHSNVIVLRLSQLDPDSPLPATIPRELWSALYCYVAAGSNTDSSLEIELPLPSTILHDSLLAIGALLDEDTPNYHITRSALFQNFHYASTTAVTPPFPYIPTPKIEEGGKTKVLAHPQRPPKPAAGSEVYSRLVPHLDSFFKLAVCGPNDVGTLHDWLNNKRVDEFWQEAGTWEAHEKFLAERAVDRHVIPVIGSYLKEADSSRGPELSEEATYSEIYWVKEDRLGVTMVEQGNDDVRNWDRGIHVLVGNDKLRGPQRVRAWLPSLVHYCFLDDVRTQRVMAEPNEKNIKMLQYFESVGFKRQGSVVFPHKTAALMVCERNAFYELCPF
ncbi:hypothetical protein P7C70_g1893, partial [Phenoliferia sp. Uapishka_3]